MDEKLTEYMSTSEAAAHLRYSVQHTRLLVRQGLLQAARLGRDWLVLRESVETYRRSQTRIWPDLGETAASLTDVVNVASVPQRSPFRYPGGKTWLVPRVRLWLGARHPRFDELVEPFAGGAIVGLTAVCEGLVNRATLVELDADVASVWKTILGGQADWLAQRIVSFEVTPENVREVLRRTPRPMPERAFATILRNRVNRGGILAPGAGLVKLGENGRGLSSRWYPNTLRRRILAIAEMRDRVEFIQGDGLRCMRERARLRSTAFFIDPPYTVAGRRLYSHSTIDHDELFRVAQGLAGDFLITYDDAEEIRALARSHGLQVRSVPMKNTHHQKKMELLIGRDLSWL